MARLPNPGGDAGQWGEILNDFLSQSISADGSLNISTVGAPQLRPGAVTSTAIANGAVTAAKIADGAIGQNQLADDSVSAAKLQNAGQANGPVVLDDDGLVPAAVVPMQAVADSDEVTAAYVRFLDQDGHPLPIGSLTTIFVNTVTGDIDDITFTEAGV